MDIGTAFEKAMSRAGIEDFRFHDLRHTVASHFAMRGVSLRAIAQLLGHRTLQMVMRYSHLLNEVMAARDGHQSDTSGQIQKAGV